MRRHADRIQSTCLCGLRSLEAQIRHRQITDEYIKNSTYMVCRDQVVRHH
ncbi:MAG: hypothetical protein ABI357_01090 [Granulicella sp.]